MRWKEGQSGNPNGRPPGPMPLEAREVRATAQKHSMRHYRKLHRIAMDDSNRGQVAALIACLKLAGCSFAEDGATTKANMDAFARLTTEQLVQLVGEHDSTKRLDMFKRFTALLPEGVH